MPSARRNRRKNGKLRGRGIGYFIEEAAIFNDRMVIRFDPSGTLMILAGTHSHGQGHQTVYAQMVHEWLGVPIESISFVQGDTNEVAVGRGTYGSRSMHVGGNALKKAADAIIEKAKPMAAMMLEAAAGDIEFKDGSFHIVGTDRSLPLTAVAQSLHRPMFLPPQFEVGLEASGTFAAEPSNYPNGCHVCEVEIDPETGVVTLARYVSVGDVGKIVNSLLCEGQIHGGVAQGVGQALMESIVFDTDGQLVTGSFQDYAMPRADRFSGHGVGTDRGAGHDQPARHQGRGRSRRHRRAAGRGQRHSRRAAAARHRSHRHAGHAEAASGRRSTRRGS